MTYDDKTEEVTPQPAAPPVAVLGVCSDFPIHPMENGVARTRADAPSLSIPASTARNPAPTQRLALSKLEAAASLGVSIDFLERHIVNELRVVRVGRRRLIPVRELERWLDRQAALPLAGKR